MKSALYILFFFTIVMSPLHGLAAEVEGLGGNTVLFKSQNPSEALNSLVGNLKLIFSAYRPALDSSSQIVSPVQVGGTPANPTLRMVIKKCVLIICETVDFNALISARPITGSCNLNYLVTADLSRSGRMLSDNYSKLLINVCANFSGQEGRAALKFGAERGPRFEEGMIQGEVLNLLRLQVTPVSGALGAVLKGSGAQQVGFR